MADHDDGPAIETSEAADNGMVVGEGAIAMEFYETVAEPPDVIERGRPLQMARDLRPLPWCQAGIDFGLELMRGACEAL